MNADGQETEEQNRQKKRGGRRGAGAESEKKAQRQISFEGRIK